MKNWIITQIFIYIELNIVLHFFLDKQEDLNILLDEDEKVEPPKI